MRPTFTVLIGSIGRPSLRATLDSIAGQRRLPGDQCIVVFDQHAMSHETLDRSVRLVEDTGLNGPLPVEGQFVSDWFTGLNTDGVKVIPAAYRHDNQPLIVKPGDAYSWLGVEQINHAFTTLPITGSHIFTLGDDDIFVPGAYEVLREVCARDQSRPVIYRFLSPARDLLWDRPRLRSCLISGCCIAAPRQFVGLHPTDIETTHDYRWMVDILAAAKAAGKAPVWLDYLGVVARPVEGMSLPVCSGAVVDEVEQED